MRPDEWRGLGHVLLEHEFSARGVVRDRLRVLAVEAGEAEAFVGQIEGAQDAADREIPQ